MYNILNHLYQQKHKNKSPQKIPKTIDLSLISLNNKIWKHWTEQRDIIFYKSNGSKISVQKNKLKTCIINIIMDNNKSFPRLSNKTKLNSSLDKLQYEFHRILQQKCFCMININKNSRIL